MTAKQTIDMIYYSTRQITGNSVQGYRSFVFVNKNQKRHKSQMIFCNEIVGVSRVNRDRLYNKQRHGHIDIKDHDDVIKWKHDDVIKLAICAGNSPVPGEFPAQRPVTRSFDVFFDLRLNKRLSKQPWSWWFETPAWSLWRHRNA